VLFSKENIEEALRALVEEFVAAGIAATIRVVGGVV
jgi:hypothetical protein